MRPTSARLWTIWHRRIERRERGGKNLRVARARSRQTPRRAARMSPPLGRLAQRPGRLLRSRLFASLLAFDRQHFLLTARRLARASSKPLPIRPGRRSGAGLPSDRVAGGGTRLRRARLPRQQELRCEAERVEDAHWRLRLIFGELEAEFSVT